RAEALLAWLEPALSNRDDLTPDPLTVERELGRSSLSFGRARGVLERLWAELRAHSEVVLKRQLWDGLLREAYGTELARTRCSCSTPIGRSSPRRSRRAYSTFRPRTPMLSS